MLTLNGRNQQHWNHLLKTFVKVWKLIHMKNGIPSSYFDVHPWLPSGKPLHNELERSTMLFSWATSTISTGPWLQ